MPHDGAGSPGSADMDERLLIKRCRAGDIAAFEPLVEKYRQRVWRLAFQVLRDREEAWDCAQDAFVRAFQSLASFRGQSAFYTWLFRIAMNVATTGCAPGVPRRVRSATSPCRRRSGSARRRITGSAPTRPRWAPSGVSASARR